VLIHYLTHPQVAIDPAIAVPDWDLSETGLTRARLLAESAWAQGLTRIISSHERKAVTTAGLLAQASGCAVEIHPELGENDRSSTGFLPPPAFEAMADAFFARPRESVRGWERAVDAQARIAAGIAAALASRPVTGRVCIVGHGAVGTLLMLHAAREPISRMHDQPAGGGNIFSYDSKGPRLIHRWRRLEDVVNGEPRA
jgi:broad specificity phosphatase PhoE